MKNYRAKLDVLLAQCKHHCQCVAQEQRALTDATSHLQYAEEAQQILQQTAKTVQESAHKQIAEVVSMCLEAIFDDPYQFEIVFEKKRGRTEAKLLFIRDGHYVDPMTAAGGGPKDVATLALRLARIVLARPYRRRFLVLDEPMSHLKPYSYYGSRIIDLFNRLATEQNIQIVMVNNIKDYQTGKIEEIP